MQRTSLLVTITALVGLAACDNLDNDLDRAAAGAAIGCVAGEVFVNGRCVEGAIVGGATGAVADEF